MSGASIPSIAQPHPQAVNVNRGAVQPRKRWLRVIQGIWLVLVLIDLASLLVGVPIYYQSLFTVCTGPVVTCPDTGQLTAQALPVLLHAGFSLQTYAFYVIVLDVLTTLPFLLVGALIIWRKSNTWMGLFVSFLLINMGCLGLSLAHALPDSSNPLISILGIASILPTLLYYPCLSFFFSTFPDGRFVPRWSWALIGLWVVNTFFWAADVHSPFSISNWPPLLEAGWLSLVFGGSACVQLYRFLRVASPIQRQQIKWLLYGFVPVIVLPLCLSLYMTFVPALNQPGAYLVNTPNSFLLIIMIPLYRLWYLPVPFCVGIALLRYRLWDIDRVINRTLVYGLLTAILVSVYFVLVFSGQALLANLIGPHNEVVLIASTLLVAALFQPLRRSIQQFIDRRFYRRKYDAQKTLAVFSSTLREAVDMERLRMHLLTTVQETMQPSSLSLWIRPLKQTSRKDDFPNTKE